MKKSLEHSALILNMNSRLFINALEGVTEEMAQDRISDHNNPLNWIATYLLGPIQYACYARKTYKEPI